MRSFLAQSMRLTGILRSSETAAKNQLNILCYHRILPTAQKAAYFCPDLVVTPEAFHNHCQTLAEFYRVLPLAEAVATLQQEQGNETGSGNNGNAAADKPIVALTFDDGYVDNLKYAAPILAEFEQRATFFVVSGLMGTSTPPWYDLVARCVLDLAEREEGCLADGSPAELALGLSAVEVVEGAKAFSPELRKSLAERLCDRLDGAPQFADEDLVMNAQQLRELQKQGHEIGSHSVSHEILPLLSDQDLEEEIQLSKQQLEDGLQQPISSFCYPNGDFDDRCLEMVEKHGYDQAVTTRNGSNKAATAPFTLKRRFIHEERLADGQGRPSASLLRAQTSGLLDRLLRRGGQDA
ncbi:MAG: polysaccharide deacetylase family protein [Planctomycetes bacterium]|nr:polysaccharide deacetylase family protein [Planctomycetota bacterium]MCP4771009.1 polysaccharide deacetylase family protein [Planctomycetota bacterium]MCP4861728.1 polysaccharide deacetylase family protein [Planctomycetota bacterium]